MLVSIAFGVYRRYLGRFTHDNAEAIIAAFTIYSPTTGKARLGHRPSKKSIKRMVEKSTR